jgi:hypothetical protein
LAWLSNRLPPCWGWLPNDVSAGRGLAVAWLKRGECRKVLELGVPATVIPAGKGRGVPVAAVIIGVDPHKAPHTAVAISAAEEPLGELRVRACVVQTERLLAWPRPGRSGPGQLRVRAGQVTCWPSSWYPRASGCWTCSPSSARGSAC